MACLIYEGIALECNDGKSGTTTAWVTEWSSVTSGTVTSGTITQLTQAASTKFWKIDLPTENFQFKESTTGGKNVPYSTKQTLTFDRLKNTAKLRNWIATCAVNRFMILLLDANGTYKMMGYTGGAYLLSAEGDDGKMFGDFTGTKFTFESAEPNPAPYVSVVVTNALSYGA